MTVDCFLDTNVLFYAAMARFTAPAKYERARWIIAETDFGLSGQVLQEFFVNVTRKTNHDQIYGSVRAINPFRVH
ncbi:hypothetical protein [Bradyrhizobium sp.]|jgi:predicted nucleic acid-binding protein|uniref:hypothetical protein n=1 Tax=Bradyrhizobium sp. TaxID=376 RepID=UPI003C148706